MTFVTDWLTVNQNTHKNQTVEAPPTGKKESDFALRGAFDALESDVIVDFREICAA